MLREILPLHKRVLLWFIYVPLHWMSSCFYKIWMKLSDKASDLDDYIWDKVDHSKLFKGVLSDDILECTFKTRTDAERALVRYIGDNAKVIQTWSIKVD